MNCVLKHLLCFTEYDFLKITVETQISAIKKRRKSWHLSKDSVVDLINNQPCVIMLGHDHDLMIFSWLQKKLGTVLSLHKFQIVGCVLLVYHIQLCHFPNYPYNFSPLVQLHHVSLKASIPLSCINTPIRRTFRHLIISALQP